MTHTMTKTQVHPTGATEWKCQSCQRHFIMMMDNVNLIVLAEGENVEHAGAAFDTAAVFREYLEDDT